MMKRVAALVCSMGLALPVALGAGVACLTACGAQAPHATVLPVPPPQAVLSLTFLLVPAQGGGPWAQSANDALEAGFIKAGYKVTKEAGDPHDAVITVGLNASEKQSAITFYRDGQRVVDYVVRVNLSVKDPSGVVDLETFEYVANAGQTDANDGLAAVNKLSDAIRFKIWAMKLVASRATPVDSASAGPADSASPAASAAPDGHH